VVPATSSVGTVTSVTGHGRRGSHQYETEHEAWEKIHARRYTERERERERERGKEEVSILRCASLMTSTSGLMRQAWNGAAAAAAAAADVRAFCLEMGRIEKHSTLIQRKATGHHLRMQTAECATTFGDCAGILVDYL